MKKQFIPLSFLLLTAFASCTKEAADQSASLQSAQLSSVQSEQASTTFSIVQNDDGTITATMQPDSTNGQDAFVEYKNDDATAANANFSTLPEIDISAWTSGGIPFFLRSYLRFADLAKIPSAVNVLSATLYLYGLDNSAVVIQGNSNYPGSAYNDYGTNRCIIEPAESSWDETTITWNNQPKASDKLHVTIPKSTSQWNYDVALSDVKAMVSKAIKNPDKNNGVRISLATEIRYRNMAFATSEAIDPARRPKLVVTYSN